jgi:co-chaperonin GroES (HSP10)
MMNGSGIMPMGFNVLVKPEDVEKTTKGGIILPDVKLEKDEFGRMEGILVATSPMAFSYAEWPKDFPKPQPGDRVLFSRYAGNEVMGKDGGKYWLMKDESIVGVMNDG